VREIQRSVKIFQIIMRVSEKREKKEGKEIGGRGKVARRSRKRRTRGAKKASGRSCGCGCGWKSCNERSKDADRGVKGERKTQAKHRREARERLKRSEKATWQDRTHRSSLLGLIKKHG
jgi:hypothetical protein